MTILHHRRAAGTGLVACAALMSAGLTAPPAQAHTGLTSSDPADGASLARSPSRVTLSFNQKVDQRYITIAVTGPSGRSYARGTARAEGREASQGLAADAPAGRYRVAFRVVSVDGHPVSGTLAYTLTPPSDEPSPTTVPSTGRPATRSTPAPEAAEVSAGGGSLWRNVPATVVLVLVLFAGAGAGACVVRRRRVRHGR